MNISKYTHRCIIQEGDLAGNEYTEEVESWQHEYQEKCQHCGERLVTSRRLINHIYSELTKEWDL